MFASAIVPLLALVCTVAAEDIFIQVGANKTSDATTIFQPNNVTAKVGDTVWFNFTSGNHTAIQADFAAPCLFIHDHTPLENGFQSPFMVVNGTAQTYPVPIVPANVNTTFWFFDYNTCGLGGVGVINQNASTDQTIDGFIRNAKRLNGTATASATASSTGSGSAASASASGTTSGSSSGAERTAQFAIVAAAPLLLVGLFL